MCGPIRQPVAVALEDLERERGLAQDVRVARVRAQRIGQGGRADPRSGGDRLPGAELAADLDQVRQVVARDEVVEARDLVGERRPVRSGIGA